MVNVYDEDGNVIARVRYNNNLDRWNGHRFNSGSLGHHLGITRLKDGRYVLIHGSDWEGESSTARIISAEQALQEILRSGNEELLDDPRFKDLKKLIKKELVEEDLPDENK